MARGKYSNRVQEPKVRASRPEAFGVGENLSYANSGITRFLLHPAICRIPHVRIMNRKPQARWVVDCRYCLGSFTHSEVGRARRLIDHLCPTAPEFPPDGE